MKYVKLEPFAIVGAVWALLIAIPFTSGGLGPSWDATNHQVYLGWIANEPRFDLDFWAAATQSFQFPYLYWPLFKLSEAGLTGTNAGVVLALLSGLAVPPVWMTAKACLPDSSWYGLAMRCMAVLIAFCSGLVISIVDSSANDLLAAIPLLWAIAIPLASRSSVISVSENFGQVLSGLLAGVAIAFKFSNVPPAIALPILWFVVSPSTNVALKNLAVGCTSLVFGFLITYGYWGWLLYKHFGSPLYPFLQSLG